MPYYTSLSSICRLPCQKSGRAAVLPARLPARLLVFPTYRVSAAASIRLFTKLFFILFSIIIGFYVHVFVMFLITNNCLIVFRTKRLNICYYDKYFLCVINQSHSFLFRFHYFYYLNFPLERCPLFSHKMPYRMTLAISYSSLTSYQFIGLDKRL